MEVYINPDDIETYIKDYSKKNIDFVFSNYIKVQGKETTSRDKRLDFLYEQFLNHFKPSDSTPTSQVNTEAPKIPPMTPEQAFEPATNVNKKGHDDLPFG